MSAALDEAVRTTLADAAAWRAFGAARGTPAEGAAYEVWHTATLAMGAAWGALDAAEQDAYALRFPVPYNARGVAP